MIPAEDADYATIYNKSLDLLSRREHSAYELIQKLKQEFKKMNYIQMIFTNF